MSLARQVALTTAAPTAQLIAPSATALFGVAATNALSTAIYYIKFYWEGTGTAPPNYTGNQPATTLPVAGTTTPTMTIAVPTTGGLFSRSDDRIINGGRIWYWITLNPGPADATALGTGGDQVTFFYG